MDNVKRLASSLIFVLVGLSGPSRAQDGSHSWTSGGPEGDYSQVGLLAARGNVLFAAKTRGILSGGVYQSSNGGQRWDLSLPEGSITSLTIHPSDPSVIFATTYFSERPLFKSTDEGRSWRAITEGFDEPIAIYSLAIDPVDSKVIYAGGERYVFGYGVDHGVFMKSLDGGESWQPAPSGAVPVIVRDLKIDPEDRGTLYAVTETFNAIDANRGGLVRITDGGQQWTDISAGLPRGDGHNLLSRAIFIDPDDHSTLYVHLESFGVYRSRDAGATWRPINDGLPRYLGSPNLPSVALSWDHHGTLYAGLNPLGLFKSVDGGDHWTPVNFASAIWGLSAGVGPRSLIYVFGPLGVYRSADGGDSWTDASQGLAGSSISALATDPTTQGVVYAGSCYLYESADYDLGDRRFKPPNRSRCGLFRSLDRGRTWSATSLLTAHEAGFVRALAVDARTGWIYAAMNEMSRSEDHGVTWHVLPRFSQIAWSIKVIAIDPRRSILYLGTENGGAYKSEDGGNTWIQINNGLTVGGPSPYGFQTVTGFAIDPLDTNVIFAATQVGVYKTVDGGKAWTRVTPQRFYSRVAIDPSNPKVVYAGTWFSQFDPATGVFRSDDGGMTWTWASDGLPTSASRWVWDLVVDPRNSSLYIATSGGLYESRGDEISWRPMNEEFSHFRAQSLALDAIAPGTLHAGTGAGVFSLGPLPASAGNSGAPGK